MEPKAQAASPRTGWRVLVTAYACEPNTGSESGLGWNWTKQVAQRNDTVLLTRENNVAEIRTAASRHGLERLEVIGFDLPYWMCFWKRGKRGAMLYFYLWQVGIALRAKRLDRERNFDLVHHQTFASSWTPSGLAWLNKPFVWGPIGQHPRIPKIFLRDASLGLRLSEAFKAGAKWTALHLDPFWRLTRARASVVLSLGSEFEKRSSIGNHPNLQRMLSAGVERIIQGKKTGMHVLFSGRLVPLKGPELALAAFAQARIKYPELHMTFLGEGPLAPALKQQASDLKVSDAVSLAGKLPMDEALKIMADADFFLFPSFEGAGMVVPEAMAASALVVCLDFGGPGEMVAGGRGLAVPLGTSVERTQEALAQGLLSLLDDPARCETIRACALDWIREEMLWERRGERLQEIYGAVLGAGTTEQ